MILGRKGSGSEQFKKATVSLTDAQVKALPTTIVEIVAAPGPGKVLIPTYVLLRLLAAVDYANIDGDAYLKVDHGLGGAFVSLLFQASGFVSAFLQPGDPTDGIHASMLPTQVKHPVTSMSGADTGFYDSDIVNKALAMSAYNGASGDFTGGNAANVLTVTVFYATIEF